MRNPKVALLSISLICAGCSGSPSGSAVNAPGGNAGSVVAENSEVPLRRYALRGQVVRIDSTHSSATIRHEKIEGWMDAMTMNFPVKDATAFRGLHAGDRVTATLYVRDQTFWIGEVHSEF